MVERGSEPEVERATVTFECHGDLGSLVRGDLAVTVDGARSVKDAIESVGIPHTEVVLVLVDGASVRWNRRLVGGEHVAMFGPFSQPPAAVSEVLPPPIRRPPAFAADGHLGTLARRLRLLGFDTWYANDVDDAALADISVSQERVLLTRDRQLLMRRTIQHGALIRASDPTEQVAEVVQRFDLAGDVAPRTRCVNCNGSLAPASGEDVADALPPGTRAAGFDRFARCLQCGQVFWPGAHDAAIEALIAGALEAAQRTGSAGPRSEAQPPHGPSRATNGERGSQI